MSPPSIPASRMRDGLQVIHTSIQDFASIYRTWLTLAPAYSYGPALDSLPSSNFASPTPTAAASLSSANVEYQPNAETLARAYCPIAGPRWDEHRERIMASTSLKGLTVLRSQVESELAALERLAAQRASWDEPHPYSNGTHHIRFWEELLYVAFTFGPVMSIHDRFAFSMSAALRRKKKMRKPRAENVNTQSVKVDMVSQNGDRWTRLYIIKPERLRQEFREAESYMVDEQESSSASESEDDTQAQARTGEQFQDHVHTTQCSGGAHSEDDPSSNELHQIHAPVESIAFDVAARKCSLTRLIHELRAAADTEATARVQRSEEYGRKLPFIPIHVEILVTRMELQSPTAPIPSGNKDDASARFYQMSEWDRFNHRLAAIAKEAQRHNVNLVFGYRSLPFISAESFITPSAALTSSEAPSAPMGLPKIPTAPTKPLWRTTKNINLDVTAMIALVSDTTHGKFHEMATHDVSVDETKRHPKLEDGEHGSGALYQHHFRTFSIRKEALEARAAELALQDDQQDEASRALDNAAAKEGRALAIQLEREMNTETLFDAILGPIWGQLDGQASAERANGDAVQLFATVGAFDRLRRVSATVGGPNEKRRVKALLGDEGVDPQDFWTGSKWAGSEYEELRRCLLLPIQPLQDLGPGGFESLTRLKQVYPDLPRAHFISHMIDTLESCLSELWGADWRDISEDLPRSKYKKLRQSTVHQAGGQTYTTLRSMHACARYGMTTLTSNMDSVQWLLKEMSRRPYSEQTRKILEDTETEELERLRKQEELFYSCFIVLHPRSLSEQMRVTTEAPAWREVLEGYPGGHGPPSPPSTREIDAAKVNGHSNTNGRANGNGSAEKSERDLDNVDGYIIDDGTHRSDSEDKITSSNSNVMYSTIPHLPAVEDEIETHDSSHPGSSYRSDSLNDPLSLDTIKKSSAPLAPMSLQPEVEPIFYPHSPGEALGMSRSRLRTGRVRRWFLGPKPPARLSIRHYRWWPFAKLERNWIRLTDVVAWKDPATRASLHQQPPPSPSSRSHPLDSEHYSDDVQPGLAWLRTIQSDLRLNKVHWPLLCSVLIGWIIGFAYLAKSLWYHTAVVGFDGVSRTPAFLSCTSTYWLRNAECGLDGVDCEPFYTPTAQVGQPFRCPAGCIDVTLLNPRAIGDQLVNYQPLVVGGGDGNKTYRGDSFICAAAIHAGIIDNSRGGCGSVRLIGDYAGFQQSKSNGIDSVGFDSVFPVAYRFETTQGEGQCTDRRYQGYILNAILSALVGFALRPKPIVFFWILACVGYWHVNLVSYPRSYPPPIGSAIGDFLPFLFTCYAIWRLIFRFVWPNFFARLPIESTVWTLGLWWIGVLLNVVFDKVPIQRLVARDIQQQPGSLVAVIIIAIVVLIIALNQIRVMQKTGYLTKYLCLYVIGGVLIGLAAAVPNETLRLHHYIIALVLLPACAFPTRLCLMYVAFLLGMFTNGVARWSFDGLLEDDSVVQGDATGGTARPSFNTTSSDWNVTQAVVRWNEIPQAEVNDWDGYMLLVDDVLRYQGSETSFNLSQGLIEVYEEEKQGNAGVGVGNDTVMELPHYVRLAFSSQGSPGDFTRAAVARFGNNASWIAAPLGAT
ncbi:uncharacterized protein MEPE_04100 [Melanopsichium pennsylvanicum]|uniref:LCCL domain-containing protein n=2 Tax=Melanopsichium pennsylvanicum TaxID=63383 RepID=A0AAJ4XP87_9BASI|nr:hypothetical protein (N-terminal fragment) [Melanopsichium pennsylvanicum 4]SNX85391.1 uncharacterized protein MEPE_04100 [Melanopsichium pennsylvanicum]